MCQFGVNLRGSIAAQAVLMNQRRSWRHSSPSTWVRMALRLSPLSRSKRGSFRLAFSGHLLSYP